MCKKFVIVNTKKEIRIRFGNLQNQNGLCMTACKNNLQKTVWEMAIKKVVCKKKLYNNCNINVIRYDNLQKKKWYGALICKKYSLGADRLLPCEQQEYSFVGLPVNLL